MNSAGEILRNALIERIERNPSYSLRAMARHLGVSHTYLSLVMNGKKTLSPARGAQFSQILGLGQREAKALSGSERFSKEDARQVVTRGHRTRVDQIRLEMDHFKLVSQWYHLAILDLTQIRGFRSDPEWISRRLGISLAETKAAIDRMERLGLLVRRAGRLVKAKENLVIMGYGSAPALREFHSQMIHKGLEALFTPGEAAYERRLITGVTIPADPSRMPKAKKMIERFRRKMMDYLSSGDSTELYQLNFQLFSLTKNGGHS